MFFLLVCHVIFFRLNATFFGLLVLLTLLYRYAIILCIYGTFEAVFTTGIILSRPLFATFVRFFRFVFCIY